MLLGVVLLYVGAVLVVNGIWLVGQARVAAGGPAAAAAHPTLIGFVGLVAAVTLVVQGNRDGDLASVRSAGYILLFAFTYLWVAANQFLNAGGHGFGWYCLFVAITAVAAGIYTFSNADGNDASIYLGVDWFAWAVLWFLFFLLLALDRPIARVTGWFTILVGVATSWVFAILLLEGELAF
jgi:hypothetical protein